MEMDQDIVEEILEEIDGEPDPSSFCRVAQSILSAEYSGREDVSIFQYRDEEYAMIRVTYGDSIRELAYSEAGERRTEEQTHNISLMRF